MCEKAPKIAAARARYHESEFSTLQSKNWIEAELQYMALHLVVADHSITAAAIASVNRTPLPSAHD